MSETVEVCANIGSRKRLLRTAEEKRRIVDATLVPGASIARVAREHGVNANQVFQWRHEYRKEAQWSGKLAATKLLPVTVTAEPRTRTEPEVAPVATPPRSIHIELPGLALVSVESGVDPDLVRTVLGACCGDLTEDRHPDLDRSRVYRPAARISRTHPTERPDRSGSRREKNQHLMIVFAAAASEMAMYESLMAAATASGDHDVAKLAQILGAEEREDYDQVWNLLDSSANEAFQSEITETPDGQAKISTYLTDAIAAEKSFETQLNGFAKETEGAEAAALFAQHAIETKEQYERLTARLENLGSSPSGLKSFFAHIFNFAPKMAQLGHDATEKLTQDLMMAYAVENAEIAMYESLAIAARAIGDAETEQLARSIQSQEKETADKVWAQIAPAAEKSIESLRLARAS